MVANAGREHDPEEREEHDRDPNEAMDPKDLLEEIILAIVDEPEQIKIVEITDKEFPDARIMHVDVAPRDRGKVIGKEGVIALSLRYLFSIIGQRAQQQIEVRINGGQNRPRPRPDFRQQQQQPQFPPGTQMMMVPVPPGYIANNGVRPQRRPGRFNRF